MPSSQPMYRAGLLTLASMGSIRGQREVMTRRSLPAGSPQPNWRHQPVESPGTGRQFGGFSRESAHVDVLDEADAREPGDGGRAAIAHQREWDPGDRHDPHGHPDVLEDLEHEHG